MICVLQSRFWKTTILILGLLVLLLSMLASILYGINNISLQSAVDAYLHFDGSDEHLIVKQTRVPRALIAAAVGASLAIAGALMQAITRNPLASPSILGINTGAGLFIVAFSFLFDSAFSLMEYIWIGFLGAGVTTIVVYLLGSVGRDGMTPLKITLAGSAISTFAFSITSLILLLTNKSLDEYLHWLVGSVAGRDLAHLVAVFPYILIAWIGSWFVAKPMNLLAIGQDVAVSLGQRTGLTKAAAALLIVLLAGGSVAVAGPIAFIGIIIPHICRYLVGVDHRWLLPYSAVVGAILLVTADLAARFVLMPKEVPVGVATALIGVPAVIYIVRRRKYE
ncbi:iron ABC transporter permease [Brevibacillus humidisoli]|uniref:FecCD family ABC transporter permease n=1 Tax=Brevibacillus humidisoli TaxID=2895522 RepID=UPI001E566CD2|nr:iron ABC transporter permease [Brevibacillus humidisoli]UFJ39570.1 iron ABC transporter permease [Brevibacillus humidisoli]